MTGKLLVTAIMAMALAAPASAAPSAADARAIAICLKAAEDNGTFGRQCIGKVADQCIASAKETATSAQDSKACASRELAVWSELLRIALSRIRPGGLAIENAVGRSQKSWSQSLERLCPLFDGLDPGMSLGGSSYCQLQETALRVLILRRLADAVNPH